MAKEKIIEDVRDLIVDKMTNEGRTMAWLAKSTKIPYDTLYSCIKMKSFLLSQENLDKINEALETAYELPE